MKKERYFIDERSGCMAVRDRTLIGDLRSSGLHSNYPCVVKWWDGVILEKTCPTCKHKTSGGWSIPGTSRAEAQELCRTLNAGLKQEKKA